VTFNLEWGSHIYAKVKAINIVGESAYSVLGNGAQIMTVPYKPTDLNELGLTTSTEITLTWNEGSNNGGTVVIDYRVWFAIGSGSYSVLSTGITTTQLNKPNLQEGATYSFKV
jgi:hypothetical protein